MTPKAERSGTRKTEMFRTIGDLQHLMRESIKDKYQV